MSSMFQAGQAPTEDTGSTLANSFPEDDHSLAELNHPFQPYTTRLEDYLARGEEKIDICISNESQQTAAEVYVRDSSQNFKDADIRIVVTDDDSIITGDVRDGRIQICYNYGGPSTAGGRGR